MVALPPLRFTGGLASTPMKAGPNDLSDCLNVFPRFGRLVKRSGLNFIRNMAKPCSTATNLWVGWGSGSTEPVSIHQTIIAASTSDTMYFGCDQAFHTFAIWGWSGQQGAGSVAQWYAAMPPPPGYTVQYWNGSAWTTVQDAKTYLPQRSLTAGSETSQPFPWFPIKFTGSPSGAGLIALQMRGTINQPTDWATKTIAGQTLYWLRIKNTAAAGETYGAFEFLFGGGLLSTVASEESRILHINNFVDRRGTPHEFIAFLYGQDGTTLRFALDGTTLNQSVSLQPDDGSKVFSARTRVSSFYHPATDRIIGSVEDHTWFYAMATKDGNIYNLSADPFGTDTPYQGVAGGLRTALPIGPITAFYDGRFFVADGQTIIYSSPDVYPDIWPNNNEISLQDAGGGITGMVSVGGVLAVFKRNNIWVVQSDGSADGYVGYAVPGNVGCVGHKTIAVAGNQAYFLAEDGLYSFNGQEVRKITDKISGAIGNRFFSSNAELGQAVYSSQFQQYRLFYPSNDNSTVLDRALYVDLTGLSVLSTEGAKEISFWPQGKKDATDFFEFTCVAQDNTTDVNRIVAGDRFGNMWEMDKGYYDAWSPVKFSLTTHRIGLGSAQKNLVRWVTPTQPAEADHDWTLTAYVDGHSNASESVTVNAKGENVAAAFFAAAATWTNGYTFDTLYEESVEASQSLGAIGRYIQFEMEDSAAGPWSLDAAEIEVNRYGRRG